MVSQGVIFSQDTADSLQDPPTPLFPSRPITKHKSQEVPEGEGQHVTHEELSYHDYEK